MNQDQMGKIIAKFNLTDWLRLKKVYASLAQTKDKQEARRLRHILAKIYKRVLTND